MTISLRERIRVVRQLIALGARPCRWWTAGLLLLAMLSACAFGITPLLLARWINSLAAGHDVAVWLSYFALYVLAYAIAYGCRGVQLQLYAHLECAIYGVLTRQFTARAIQQNTREGVGLLSLTIWGASTLILCAFFVLLPACLESFSMLIIIGSIIPLPMMLPLILYAGIFLFLTHYGTQCMTKQQRALNPHIIRVFDLVAALFNQRNLLQRYAQYPLSETILRGAVDHREQQRLKMGWTRTWTIAILDVWVVCSIVVNLGLALLFYAQGRMTMGEVVAIESVFFLVHRRLELWNRGHRETGLALEKCREGLAIAIQPMPQVHTPTPPDAYRNRRWNVMHGKTGVGKSTWLHKRWQHAGDGTALLPQHPELLPTTFRINMTLGADIDNPQLATMLRMFHLETVIARLPHWLDTIVSTDTEPLLSGGEMQRLCLARTLLHWDGEELLLDEPTSAQSTAEAQATLAALRQWTTGKTVWIVSHDPAVWQWADILWECTGWDQIESRPQTRLHGLEGFPSVVVKPE